MKPSLPKGTRDFGPTQMARRKFIIQTISHVFEQYGFQLIETPAFENLTTLLGKYGSEGDQLLYKVLNSGNFLKDVDMSKMTADHLPYLVHALCDKGLRYDLTIPLARYVVMHRNELVLPFKRYQIQPVWRADRPQKGRYREFWQCDADIVGSNSMVCEAEIISLINTVFNHFKIHPYTIRINHRDLLSGIAQKANISHPNLFYVILDKMDKIGTEKVREELIQLGLTKDQIDSVFALLNITGTTEEKLHQLERNIFSNGPDNRGLIELRSILEWVKHYGLSDTHLMFDLSLARGLNYYTGCIFEITIPEVSVGSVCGGGRYDNLTALFNQKEQSSGVGISFGIDRLYDALTELHLFPSTVMESTTQVLICHIDSSCQHYAMTVLSELRKQGINAEVYPDGVKIQKQLDYANRKQIPFAIIIGETEKQTHQLALKNLNAGTQTHQPIASIVSQLKEY